MKTTTVLYLLSSFLVTTYVSSQTPDHLVGLTRVAPALRHHDHWNCQPLNVCPVPLPAAGIAAATAGGTGWDPVRSGAWVTNGTSLALVGDNCNMLCPPVPIPTLGGNVFATGLDVVESGNRILVLDNTGRIHTLSNTCPPVTISVCNTGLLTGLNQVVTGLASDEGNGYTFIAVTNPATGNNRIAVAALNNPCQVLCILPVLLPCTTAFGSITGLACDWGNRWIYATDGLTTIAIRYAVAPNCPVILNIDCCASPIIVADPFVGLAVRTGRATSHGQPCGNGACPSCPMVHTLANDPNLGNAQFALDLQQAPVNSLAWCLIGVSACSNAGLVVPPLCGPIYTGPLLGTLGPNSTLGFGVCNGSTSFSFPLPAWPGLAGWTMSSQCISLCVTGPNIGTAISNCLSFTLQGN